MRRLNKLTGLPYKHGDQPTEDDLPFREGKLFYRYDKSRVKKDGYFIEYWKSREQILELSKKYNNYIGRCIHYLRQNFPIKFY